MIPLEVNPCLPGATQIEAPTTKVGLFPRGALIELLIFICIHVEGPSHKKKEGEKKQGGEMPVLGLETRS